MNLIERQLAKKFAKHLSDSFRDDKKVELPDVGTARYDEDKQEIIVTVTKTFAQNAKKR